MGKPFDELAKDVMDRFLSWDPALATQVGWHKYDGLLRDPSRRAVEYHAKKLKELIGTMEDFHEGTLTKDQAIDRDLAVHIFKLKLYEITELKLYERVSEACSEVGDSLFFLFARDVPSFEQRMASIISRVEKVPWFLESSKETLTNPYVAWNEVAIETGDALPSLLAEIEAMIVSQSREVELRRRTPKAVGEAINSIQSYNSWLKEEVLPNASKSYAISPEEYERYLTMKGYGASMTEILEVGRAYHSIAGRAMAAVSRAVVPSGNVDEAFDQMKSDHPPTFEAVLNEYRRAAEDTRRFVVEKKLASVPPGEKLQMIETPRFMRPIAPLAGQFEPGKYDDSLTGLFMLTPDDNPQLLREHSYAGIGNTTAHEAYPGHHLQGVCGNANPSRIRTLISSPDFGEGWGLYSEELMISEGYNDNPMGRLANLGDFVFRLCRQILEIELSNGNITIDQGAELLHRECRLESGAAYAESRSCAMSPTYYVSYFIGQLALLQLRDDVKVALGKKFTYRFFHDALLYSGCMPVSFMRRAVALRIKQEYGVELGPPKESIYEYAMRRAERLT